MSKRPIIINIKEIIILISRVLCCLLYRFTNIFKEKSNKKVLIFTDSRGTEIENILKQKNPFYSYIDEIGSYEKTYFLCPEKFTSILDFIEYLKNTNKRYDVIVLHCGIVDFAPRPMSSYKEMYRCKSKLIESNGWKSYFENRNDYLCEYYSEKTMQFMSLNFLQNEIIPILKKIDNLVYVGINPVLTDWIGNYWRKRPLCINKQLEQDKLMHENINYTVNINHWSEEQIKKYTVDNVHYNRDGLKYLGKKIKDQLSNLSFN